jgi:hypothetical protein
LVGTFRWIAAEAVLAAGLITMSVAPAWAQKARPERGVSSRVAAGRGGFRLFAGATSLDLVANRVYCGLDDAGRVCSVVPGGSLPGGGSWPRGTPDQYIFNSGIQIAGIVAPNAGFAWAGDTVGAWAIDTRGPGEHMRRVSGIYNSLAPADTVSWPSAAYARDTSLFGEALIGRKTASLQDTWARYWDGDTTLVTGRSHTMGVLVDQRTLAFDHPAGNEDIVYVIFRITNITARNASAYQGLAAAGYTPQDFADIAALGAEFQRLSEARFNVQIPDGGYPIADAYVAVTADMDVGDATNNYASVALPFAMGLAYKSDFREPTWRYPTEVFRAPFGTAPGFVGTKFLRTPANAGLSIFTTFSCCSSPNSLFPEPFDVRQGYRYMNGSPSPTSGDGSACSYPPSRHLCFLTQSPSDQRYMQSSGPFTLAPGQSVVFAIAYVFAPALVTNPGRPSYDLNQYIGNSSMVPGVPPAGDRLVQGLDTLRALDAALGWISHADQDGSGAIEEDEVTVVRGSLLHKARVAQAMFDSRFLLPTPPEAPDFFLVPGSNQVTVVWKPSATETSGDPYFALASEVASPLYDLNYRQRDVEGYRLWRGTSQDRLELIAQFDYDSTMALDYTGDFFDDFDYRDIRGEYRCAPELGITASCPPFPHAIPLAGAVVQIPAGGRNRLANDPAQYERGVVGIVRADTAVTGGGSGYPGLRDTGVPFVFVDGTARNGTRYYYAVTAFDVNSLRSGPSSLQSAAIAKAVTPRSASGQETAGSLGAPEFIRADGSVVPTIPMPTIDPVTGIFSGPMAQTDLALGFATFVPQLISGSGALELFMDSIVAGDALNGVAGQYRLRVKSAAGTDTLVVPVLVGAFSQESGFPDFSYIAAFEAAPVDPAQNARFGAGPGFSLFGQLAFTVPGVWRLTGQGRGDVNGDPTGSALNGPRWWTESANENTPNPNGGNCAPSAGGCGPPPDPNLTAGQLSGVTTLMNVQSYNSVPNVPMRNMEGITAYFYRAADFKVYWGASGAVDSVTDETHGVRVPFSTDLYASWGILNAASFGATQSAGRDANQALLTWADIFCVAPAATVLAAGSCVPGAGQTAAQFQNTAALSPIAANGSSFAGTAALAATGNGFIFYLNGKFFLIQMAALPAAGTVWNARFYAGTVRTSTQTGGTFSFVSRPRPPAVPGMHVRTSYQGTSFNPAAASDSMMRRIHTVPDPFYATSVRGDPLAPREIRFVHVPSQSVIRIYSASGILVALLTNNDATGGGEVIWNVRSREGLPVASGIYFYHVETPDRRSRIGRFTVVR